MSPQLTSNCDQNPNAVTTACLYCVADELCSRLCSPAFLLLEQLELLDITGVCQNSLSLHWPTFHFHGNHGTGRGTQQGIRQA